MSTNVQSKCKQKRVIVIIEGCHLEGKTTLITQIASTYPNIAFVEDGFTKDKLNKHKANPQGVFGQHVWINNWFDSAKTIVKNNVDKIIILDRCPLSSYVYCKSKGNKAPFLPYIQFMMKEFETENNIKFVKICLISNDLTYIQGNAKKRKITQFQKLLKENDTSHITQTFKMYQQLSKNWDHILSTPKTYFSKTDDILKLLKCIK